MRLETFLALVEQEWKVLLKPNLVVSPTERLLKTPQYQGDTDVEIEDTDYENWKQTNLYSQKQEGYFAVGLPITVGDLSSDKQGSWPKSSCFLPKMTIAFPMGKASY